MDTFARAFVCWCYINLILLYWRLSETKQTPYFIREDPEAVRGTALLRLQWGPGNSREEALADRILWTAVAHALIRHEVTVFYRPLLFPSSVYCHVESLVMSRKRPVPSSELWILHQVQVCGGFCQVPKEEEQKLHNWLSQSWGWKTTLPFRQNDVSYNFFMIPSLTIQYLCM